MGLACRSTTSESDTPAITTLFQDASSADTEQPISSQAGPTANIRGRVTDSEGRGIHRATLRIGSTRGYSRVGATNVDGRFEIRQLPAGSYTVSASKAGYVNIDFGQGSAFDLGLSVELRENDSADEVDFTLIRGGIVEGKVVDENGLPAQAAIQLIRRTRAGVAFSALAVLGRDGLPEEASRHPGLGPVRSDDLGRYRLWGVPPSEYYVVAEPTEGASTNSLARTYFTAARTLSDARAVRVLDQDSVTVDFVLPSENRFQVHGVVKTASGLPASEGVVRAFEVSPGRLSNSPASVPRIEQIRPNGSFVLDDLAAGEYLLVASSRTRTAAGPLAEMGTHRLILREGDLTSVSIITTRGAHLAGTVEIENESPEAGASQLVVLHSAVAPEDVLTYPRAAVPVKGDGSFQLVNVFGRRLITAGASDGSLYVKTIYWRGQNVTDRGIDARPGMSIDGIKIILTRQTTLVRGTVTSEGRAASGGSLLIFAEDEDKWSHPARHLRLQKIGKDGRYSVTGLPPGRYCVVVVDYLDPALATDRSTLLQLQSVAQRIDLTVAEPRNLNLVMKRGDTLKLS